MEVGAVPSIEEVIAAMRRDLYRQHKMIVEGNNRFNRLVQDLRNDVDSPRMSPIPMCTGSATVSFDAGTSSHTEWLRFGRTLPTDNNPPTVLTNIAGGDMPCTVGWSSKADIIANAGFRLHLFKTDDTNGDPWVRVPVQWMAIHYPAVWPENDAVL